MCVDPVVSKEVVVASGGGCHVLGWKGSYLRMLRPLAQLLATLKGQTTPRTSTSADRINVADNDCVYQREYREAYQVCGEATLNRHSSSAIQPAHIKDEDLGEEGPYKCGLNWEDVDIPLRISTPFIKGATSADGALMNENGPGRGGEVKGQLEG